MTEDFELQGALLRLEQLLIALLSLIAFGAVFYGSVLDLEFETQPMCYALAVTILASIVLRDGILSTIESIRPLRPLDMLTVMYSMCMCMFVFGLLIGEPGTLRSRENMGYVGSILAAAHLLLLVFSVTSRGLALVQFNGLQLVTLATLASPQASPWCLLYVLVVALAIVLRHHAATFSAAGGEDARWRPLLRHSLWVGMALLALCVLVVPFFPDLRSQLIIELPNRPRRGLDLFELSVKLLILGGVILILLNLLVRLRKLLFGGDAGERDAKRDEDARDLLIDPLDATRAVTRALGLRGWGAGSRERLIEEYCWLVDRLAGRGFPRPPSQTARELGDRLVGAQAARPEDIDELTALFHQARYSEREIAKEQVNDAHRLARAILEAARQRPQA